MSPHSSRNHLSGALRSTRRAPLHQDRTVERAGEYRERRRERDRDQHIELRTLAIGQQFGRFDPGIARADWHVPGAKFILAHQQWHHRAILVIEDVAVDEAEDFALFPTPTHTGITDRWRVLYPKFVEPRHRESFSHFHRLIVVVVDDTLF